MRYVYRVKALRGEKKTQWSNFVLVELPEEPTAPSGLTAAIVDGGVDLAWDAPAENSGAVDQYEIERLGTVPGDPVTYLDLTRSGSAATAHSDPSPLEPGATYVYRVRALRGAEASVWSNRGEVAVPGAVPVTDAEPPVAGRQEAVTTLVKNTGRTTTDEYSLTSASRRAQGFTTGPNAGGYRLSEVGVAFGTIADPATAGSAITATINASSGGNPGDVHCTLVDPPAFAANSVNYFSARSCPLDPGTTYFVVVVRASSNTGTIRLVTTVSGAEDAGAASGWSIADTRRLASATAFDVHKIDVRGAATFPTLVGNTGQSQNNSHNLNSSFPQHAQKFTTGPNADGYNIYEVGVDFETVSDASKAGSEITVSINNPDSSGNPGAVRCQLADPASFLGSYRGLHYFIASDCTLAANTSYFVVVERANNTTDDITTSITNSSDEDPGAASGWSIADEAHHTASGSWTSIAGAYMVNVRGAAVVLPPVTTLVSNTGQRVDWEGPLSSDVPRRAQQFTTGSNANGYRMTEVGVRFLTIADPATAGSELMVTLNEKVTVDTGGVNDDTPGNALCTLTDPASFSASGIQTFYAPSTDPCPTLSASTDYFVVLARANNNTDVISVELTDSDDEDTGGATGWSIGDDTDYFRTSTNSWRFFIASLQIDIRGPVPGGDPVPSEFFETLGAAGNNAPQGIWSDGDTMWVADDDDDKIYAYDMATKGRVPSLDIDTLGAAGNNNPRGIWSDGNTMWVLDIGWSTIEPSTGEGELVDGKIFAYKMVDDPATPANEFGARDAGEDFNSLFPPVDPDTPNDPTPAGHYGADIWSNGETLWVSDWFEDRLVAYDLETKARQGGEDFTESILYAAGGSTGPSGIWSDGDTIWITKYLDRPVTAITLSTKSAVPQRNFNLLRGNGNPRGMWSDGATVWVSDGDGKIYAYALPPVPPEPPEPPPNPVSVHRVTANTAVIAVDLRELPYPISDSGDTLSMKIGRGRAITHLSCRTCTVRFFLKNMRPETEYTVDVFFKRTRPVGSVTFTTTYAKAGDVRVTDITPTSATATVNLADVYSDRKTSFHYPVHGATDTPCPKYTYYLRYKRGDDSPFDGWSEPVRLRLCASAEVPLSGLDPDTVYDLQVYDDPEFPDTPPFFREHIFKEGTWLEQFGAFTTPDYPTVPVPWTADMRTDSTPGENLVGYQETSSAADGLGASTLEPASFTYKSVLHTVRILRLNIASFDTHALQVIVSPPIQDYSDLELVFDSTDDRFRLQNATVGVITPSVGPERHRFEWENIGLIWDDNQDIQVQLVNPTVTDICDRSWWVRNKLLELTPAAYTCSSVDKEDLAAITELDFNGGAGYIPGPIKEGDFDGLTGLRTLDLGGMGLFWVESAGGQLSRDLSGGLFSDLTNLETLRLNHNSFYPRLADDAFLGLGNLRELDLRGFSKAEHDRCWSSELGAPAPREYPWNPRTGSPFAFAPLTSLETYNWDADFDTSHIAGYDYTPAPYATNNFSHVAAPENVQVIYTHDSPFSPVIDWDAPPGQSGITGYRIERRVNGKSPSCFDDGLGEHIGTTSDTSYIDEPPRPQRNQQPFNVWSVEYYVYAETSGGNVSLPARVSLPSALSVADAEGREGPNAVLRFVVTLYPSSDQTVTVAYGTVGGLTATPGVDYVSEGGTLIFAPGETTKVVEVPIIDDDIEDDGETMELHLVLVGVLDPLAVADGVATGTIRNTDPEAGPAVKGDAVVGETLTADTSGITGADGTDDAVFGYQWLAGGPAIDGATAASYELTSGEVGKTIQVRASYTDGDGSVVTLTSEETEAVAYVDGHPGPPREVRVEAGHREIYVSWQPPADEGTVPVEEYRVRYREEGGADQELHTTGLSRTIGGLTNGVAYIVQVTARNAAGYGTPSDEMSVTPDALPVWSADMRVVEYTSVSIGASSADLFSNVRATRGLQVEQLWSYTPDRDLRLELAEAVPYADELTLRVGGLSLEFPAGSSGEVKFKWEDVDVDWEDGQTIPAAIFLTSTLAEPAPNTPAMGQPIISGTAQVGEPLTADTSGIADEDGLTNATFSYQWLADDADIEGAASSTYTLADSEEGKTIKVRATFTDDAGHEESLTSEATAAIAARPNTPATGAPIIGGTAQVGGTLTADTSGIADVDGLENAAFAYQWVADDADIQGATNSTYTLADSEEGKTVKVRATFTDDAGNEESLTSEPTGEVAARLNTPATGQPAIGGTAQVGETLTADVAGIADADGLDNAAFSYQWTADDADIDGAVNSTYTLTSADVGKAIRVRVGFTDDAGNEENLTSEPTAAVADKPNTPATGQPAITGTAQAGETLTASMSSIADADGLDNVSYSYQWLAGGSEILGATGSSYLLTSSEQQQTIQVWVTFTDDAGNEETLTSAATAAVAAKPNTPATGAPTINGTAQVGETLTANTSNIADADGLDNAAFAHQWTADDADLEGATGSTYTLADSEEGKTIKVRVSFTDDAGNEESLTSEATAAVAAKPNTPATGAPTITGTAQVGETLTADTSGIADEDGLDNVSYSYQWIRNAGGTDADIAGETASTYTLVSADVGRTVKVQVSFADDAGNEETLTSAVTAAVAAKPNSPATGLPSVSGTAQAGETLTASMSSIADEDGLSNVSYSYQWLAGGSDIGGATGSTYTLTASEQGQTVQVRVSFEDDAGNQESLTSEPTAAVAAAPAPLTVSLEDRPSSHDGSSDFTFEIRFSEEVKLSYKTLRDHVLNVTGGSVKKAQRTDKPSNIPWRITVRPDGNGDVVIELPATTDCDAQGAICAKDGSGRMLSNSLSFTVSGPSQ